MPVAGAADTSSLSLQQSIDRSDALFATVEGRKSFASVLNRQRNTSGGLKLSSKSSLARLAAWARRFLDHAQAHMHVDPVQLAMIMCQSFYVEEEEEEEEDGAEQQDEARSDAGSSNDPDRRAPRTYLLSLIRTHPIWKEVRFWYGNKKIHQRMRAQLGSALPVSASAAHAWVTLLV